MGAPWVEAAGPAKWAMADSVPVLIVDDQAPFRRAARMVVTATPGFDVVGEAESGEEAVELAAALQPVSCGAARYVHKEQFGPDVVRDVWGERSGSV